MTVDEDVKRIMDACTARWKRFLAGDYTGLSEHDIKLYTDYDNWRKGAFDKIDAETLRFFNDVRDGNPIHMENRKEDLLTGMDLKEYLFVHRPCDESWSKSMQWLQSQMLKYSLEMEEETGICARYYYDFTKRNIEDMLSRLAFEENRKRIAAMTPEERERAVIKAWPGRFCAKYACNKDLPEARKPTAKEKHEQAVWKKVEDEMKAESIEREQIINAVEVSTPPSSSPPPKPKTDQPEQKTIQPKPITEEPKHEEPKDQKPKEAEPAPAAAQETGGEDLSWLR